MARSELLRVDSGFLVNGKLMVSANVTVEKERSAPLLAGGFRVGDEVVWNGPVRSIGNDHVERGMRGTVCGSKARAGFAHDFDLVVQFGSVGRSEPGADGYIVVDEARLFDRPALFEENGLLVGAESEYTGFEMISDALHNLGSNVLLTVVAGALLAYVVYSRRAAQPRARQVRRPEDRRRRQAGAAAEATQDEAQVETNKARAEVKAAKHKAAKAEAAALAAAEKADAATKARATAAAGKAARAAAAEKVAEAAKAAAAEKATAKAVAKAAAETAAAERAAAVEAANAAAAAVEELERPPSLPVMSLASAQFDTGRRAVPESTIGGQTTCIICFVNPKSHAAVPCGHHCALAVSARPRCVSAQSAATLHESGCMYEWLDNTGHVKPYS